MDTRGECRWAGPLPESDCFFAESSISAQVKYKIKEPGQKPFGCDQSSSKRFDHHHPAVVANCLDGGTSDLLCGCTEYFRRNLVFGNIFMKGAIGE